MEELHLRASAETLSRLPNARDEEFDRFVDREHGLLLIRGQPIAPSDALYSDRTAYRVALLEYRDSQRSELLDKVFTEFPHPIAYYLHRYVYAADDPNKRFQFLKDVWESMAALLFALVLGEARAQRLDGVTGVKREYVQSQTNRERLEVIIKTLEHDGPKLQMARVILPDTIHRLIELNNSRNEALAHVGTLNDEQAQRLVEHIEPSVLDVLRALEGLSDLELLRYWGPSRTRGKHRIELFCGESGSRRTAERILAPEHVATLHRRGFSRDDVYVLHGDLLYTVSPMICCRDAARGHRTELSFFKRVRGIDSAREMSFEVFGTSESYSKTDTGLQNDLDELKSMYAAKKGQRKA